MGILEGSPVPETYAGPKAWWEVHPGAVIVDHDMTADEALVKGGIDWTVSKRRLFPETLDALAGDKPLTEWVAITRDTDDRFLGMVTPSYHLFQNHEMAAMMQQVLEQGGANINTCGSLYDGKLVWMLARFDHDFTVKGDGSPTHDYFLALTGHTGRHALTFVETPVRVWCGNTAAMAIDGATARINLRHTSGMGARVEDVKRALDLRVKYRDTYEAAMNHLATRPFSPQEMRSLAETLFPVNLSDKPDEKVAKARVEAAEAKRTGLTDLYATSATLEGVGFTAYRALQAVIEYVDHRVEYRSTKRASALDRGAEGLIDGAGFDLKSKAAALLGA